MLAWFETKTWFKFIWLFFFYNIYLVSVHLDSQVIAAWKFPFDPAAPSTWLHFSRCNSFMGVFKAACNPDLPNVYPRLRRKCLWGKISKDLQRWKPRYHEKLPLSTVRRYGLWDTTLKVCQNVLWWVKMLGTQSFLVRDPGETHITRNLISSQCPKVAIQDPNRLPWRST